MQYRNLGKWGVKVSEISLGSWLTYGGATEASTANACISAAYDLGITFFDTANVYAGGRAEEIVGKALDAFPRESYFLATKAFFPMGDGPNDRGLSRKHLVEQCNLSLQRLGKDYIDLYQCHRYDPSVPVEETLLTLDDLTRQGKILYYGVSEWNAAQLNEGVEFVKTRGLHPIVSNQPLYNMLARNIEDEVVPYSEKAGIGQVVFSPLMQGVLSGKYKPGQPLPADSRAADPAQNMFLGRGQLDEKVLTRVQNLVPIAQELGLSMPQLALAWCLRLPNISSVIIGASRPDQVKDNAAASGVKLSPEILGKIDQGLAG